MKEDTYGVFFWMFSNSINMKNHLAYLLWAHKIVTMKDPSKAKPVLLQAP